MRDAIAQPSSASVRLVSLSWFPPPADGGRRLRRSGPAYYQACPALKKTACGVCGWVHRGVYDRTVRRVRDLPCGGMRIFVEFELRRVACRRCGAVKRERLDFLADNPRYTKRFAFYVGRRCRAASIQDIAEELHLEWHTVKELEMQYMREQLRRAGRPRPKIIGIDEVSIRKG
ncbi:MAG TPA: helix-turn-helix domain-containing protein, partial [Methylomirabilota bacterium]